jgi:hypothetical protein
MLMTVSAEKSAPVDRALQRLAGAVLIQALQDASSGPRRAREDALDWIYGRARGKFSFEFCCSLLGRDPADVRMRLQRFHFIPKPVDSATSPYAGHVEYLPD